MARFESGEIGPDEWRAFRLLRGTYGQRQTGDAQMLRIKIPQGILLRNQLDAIASVAERYSRGFGHITTRQNIQLHFVKLHDAEPAMRELAAAGMTTREACGNSVRNITACPYSGVASDEAFDVTPYAEALTRYLLRHPLSSVLPRKFKIAFEGCTEDHIGSAINDIGWNARIQTVDGRAVRGFRVTVAGGTATMTRAGNLLHEFLPVDEMFDCAEAIIRVFHRLGDYKHKQKNRLKFLVKFARLGWFRHRIRARARRARRRPCARCRSIPSGRRSRKRRPGRSAARWRSTRLPPALSPTAVIGPGIVPKVEPRLAVHSPEFLEWSRTNVRPQKQDGYAIVIVTTVLGDLTSAQMRLLGELSEVFGDGAVRVTMDQNLVFRWVRNRERRGVLQEPRGGRAWHAPGAGTLSDVTSCPGAESCKLAVTQSRGLGRVLADHLLERQDHRRRAAGDGHQDQRLPERLRPAPHRRHRFPGQPEEGRRRSRRRSTS